METELWENELVELLPFESSFRTVVLLSRNSNLLALGTFCHDTQHEKEHYFSQIFKILPNSQCRDTSKHLVLSFNIVLCLHICWFWILNIEWPIACNKHTTIATSIALQITSFLHFAHAMHTALCAVQVVIVSSSLFQVAVSSTP